MSEHPRPQSPMIALRTPDKVMRLSRLGALHQCRLSFMRVLLRRLKREGWRFARPRFDIDARGVGVAVYTAQGPNRSYSLVAFGHDLPPEKRSDRVIATAWDATFTLFDGVPDDADIARLAKNVPLQEAGRVTASELSVSRANRSVRLFDYVVSCLSQGRQPDADRIDAVGYLMRTTAVYGSGKLGAADRARTAGRDECAAPFQIEMLSVYLTRAFVLDLVEHMAQMQAPDTAVVLDPGLRRRFGIGNSTGLGMAPFLLNHPRLLNAWITARETALARVRALPAATQGDIEKIQNLVRRAQRMAAIWRSEHPLQLAKLDQLRQDLERLAARVNGLGPDAESPWNGLFKWADQSLGLDAQELLVSLLIEPYGDLVDDLEPELSADESVLSPIDGRMSVETLRRLLERDYDWALAIDWDAPDSDAVAWYTSEEKLEPRLGVRAEEDLDCYALPLCPGRDAARLYADLERAPDGPVAALLLKYPQHRHIVRRVQLVDQAPYAEIRDNTIASEVMPIDFLRAKLAFFGAGYFDPRSDRWVRINMFRDAPFPRDLATADADDWLLPPVPNGNA